MSGIGQSHRELPIPYDGQMPLHDFKCPACGHRFEELVKVGASPACPKCGAAPAERQSSFSAAISTASTRERALAGARRKASGVKQEQDAAHREYVKQHMDDH